MIVPPRHTLSVSALLALCSLPKSSGFSSPACKVLPGDPGWPTLAEWDSLNSTVGGRLVATVPIGNVCHNSPFSAYDKAACESLAKEWILPQTLYVELCDHLCIYRL